MTANEFYGIFGKEMQKLGKAGLDYSDFLDYEWEVRESDTTEQVRAYVRSVVLESLKDAAAENLKGASDKKKEEMWANVIREFSDDKPKDIYSILGKEKDKPLGGITDRDYKIAGIMNNLSEAEVRRMADEERAKKQNGIAEGAKADAEAQIAVAPYQMAQEFDAGNLDENSLQTAARLGMKFLRPMTYQQYMEDIAEKKGDDSYFGSLSPTTERGRANMVETGMDLVANKVNPFGKAAARIIPKVAGTAGKVKTVMGSAAPYVVGPIQDGAVDAAGQKILELTNGRPFDVGQVGSVMGSSATFPSLLGLFSRIGSQSTGPLRNAMKEFNKGIRKGETNASQEVLDLNSDLNKLKELETAFNDVSLNPKVRANAKTQYQLLKKEIAGKYPSVADDVVKATNWAELNAALTKGNQKAEKTAAESIQGTIDDEKVLDLSPGEKILFGAEFKTKPKGIFGAAGKLVSPLSQQKARMESATQTPDYKQTPWYQKATKEQQKLMDTAFKKKKEESEE